MNKKIFIIVILFCFLSLFLNVYKKSAAPACFTADEAAFGYNTYSILKTGKDEYGTSFPLRLKSFGDYKLPLYSYLSVPFINTFGLNQDSTRALNTFLAFLLPFVIFFLTKELFNKNSIAVLVSFLISVNLGLHIIGRQAHEAYLATFLISVSSLFFVKVLKKTNLYSALFFSIFILLSLFSYQSSRIIALFFLIYALFYLFWLKNYSNKRNLLRFIVLFLITLTLFGITDLIYKPERVKNLLFFNNIGFSLKINELRSEGGPRLFYNKLTVGAHDLVFQYLTYFSPQFLVSQGDNNPRFGFLGMSPITPLEYIFVFIGIYYLFKNNEKWKYFIIFVLLASPFSASLTWAGNSLTRSLFIIIPILILSSYGLINLMESIKIKQASKIVLIFLFFIVEVFFLFYSWDFYLNHYPKRALTIRSWQCGNKELANYVENNYNRFNHFYITRKNGQPYIFLLFYLKYPPAQYQKQAELSPPDNLGFGQVEQFDKFDFNFRYNHSLKNSVFIGYPDDFNNILLDPSKLKKISSGTEEVFWIYENI